MLEYLENLMVFFAVLASIAILAAVFFGILGSLIENFRTRIDRRLRTLWRVEMKIDLLLEHAGIEFEPYKGLSREVADALRRDEKIQAIKLWRGATGVGLREAKEFIEEVQRRSAP
jgi:ribosomal L7/L12-like protein